METGTHITELRRILDAEGRKQSWLAAQLGVSRSLIHSYANGLHCPQHHREAIAAALQRDVSEVFPSEIAA